MSSVIPIYPVVEARPVPGRGRLRARKVAAPGPDSHRPEPIAIFITAEIHPSGLLTDLLSRRDFRKADTAQFRTLKHNKDLCPGFAENAKRVISDYEKHRSDVHDTQGFADLGVDVAVAFTADDGTQRLGFQIKSFDDFKAWWGDKTNTGFTDKLRSQYAQAVNRGGCDLWYLVLCTDEAEHEDALRAVRAEFSSYEKVKIIDPVEALSFFRMTELEIDVAVSRRLSSEDYVMVEAKKCVGSFRTRVRPLLVQLTCHALEHGPRLSEQSGLDLLIEAARPRTAPHDLLAALEGVLDPNHDTGGYTVSLDSLMPLAALYYDQRVRFGAAADELPERLTKLLL